ncbi:MAG: Glu-tRNA(Gln) amidotransferase subunit GatE [Thaumarchaeota archaeon]|nr:Glu-tRNA(Gln) amidotransferase subunit GatE [Nitrososphaerota archaeon]
MVSIDPARINLKVGLEIHQQIASRAKLFCSCANFESKELPAEFVRKLRPTQSELGQIDAAALFEFQKSRTIRYRANDESACLVETDEEPPHNVSSDALEVALTISTLLKSRILDEIHVMRKIVIDGSNTTGFQRTMIVSVGGELSAGALKVGVQTISLEEDAARLLGESDGTREYALDRLCVPLVEVALAPISGSPKDMQDVALALGRLMRSTKKVARGLGTIRQDVNVSVMGGKVVEVKGVQKLDLIGKIVEFEAQRQMALVKISEELHKREIKEEDIGQQKDLTETISKFSQKNQVFRKVIDTKGYIYGVRLNGFGGLLGYEPQEGIRLGKELADLVRFYGLGGLFHSDELPAYEITEAEVNAVKESLQIQSNDAFVLLAGPIYQVSLSAGAVIQRAKDALKGVPSETRGPTPDGNTRFIRPRPGSARMYPETDIPPIVITKEILAEIQESLPTSWESQIEYYTKKYQLSEKLAMQVYDSDFAELFEDIAVTTTIPPSFIAATLTETIVGIARAGFDTTKISNVHIKEIFLRVEKGEFAKESVQPILESLAKGEAPSVSDAVSKLSIKGISNDELIKIISTILAENSALIKLKGEDAFSALMGTVMAQVRGRADGHLVSKTLRNKLKEALR